MGTTPKPDSTGSLQQFFGLSYANYLTVPRALLEQMPESWQKDLASLLFQLEAQFTWPRFGESIEVRLRDPRGHFVRDPLAEYRHPDRAAIEAAAALARSLAWHNGDQA